MWPFKKKKIGEMEKPFEEVEIPELPELPELPPLPRLESEFFSLPISKQKMKDELPPLPSFPSTREKIIPEIKQAVKKSAMEQPVKKFTMEQPVSPAILSKSRTREIGEAEVIKPKSILREIKPEIKSEPIFVRIDKYQESMDSFQEVKRELIEIENLLREIKEVKEREEAELQAWEQEIQDVKSKLNSIDKTIFKKLEE